LKIYDNQGRLVRILMNNIMHPGEHNLDWNGRNDKGEAVSAGVYYYILKAGDLSLANKMILLK